MGLMDGKKCLIMGVANQRSIAWGIAQALHREGAELAFTYVPDERMQKNVEKLAGSLDGYESMPLIPCDVQDSAQVEALFQTLKERWGSLDVFVHSVAFARQEDLTGTFSEISWDGYALAQHVSAFSLIEASKYAKPLLEAAGGGSIFTLSYLAAERVVEKYNVMAIAKAALECNMRYLAAEFGPSNIRVNAISAGPLANPGRQRGQGSERVPRGDGGEGAATPQRHPRRSRQRRPLPGFRPLNLRDRRDDLRG